MLIQTVRGTADLLFGWLPFVRSPDSDVWVYVDDLPPETCEMLFVGEKSVAKRSSFAKSGFPTSYRETLICRDRGVPK